METEIELSGPAREDAIWSMQSDLEHKSFLDFLSARLGLALPLHHYEGFIELDGDELRIVGHHKSNADQRFELTMSPHELKSVHLGFDDNFTPTGDSFEPLRLTYALAEHTQSMETMEREDLIYIIIGFSRTTRSAHDADWANRLEKWRSRNPHKQSFPDQELV
eukprot:TRINITY_DN9948_c0_g2_i1.p1 TRINITY_DN9948_c0_g2~~TRINITY_DN9948_c0_g2_i1.p1  ORF type:complete len:179 (-),score=36.66 TRINITY_DN9948_c0_g2_i1:548-1039(-)